MKIIYELIDANTGKVFYIGQGKKYRPQSHLKKSLWESPHETSNPFLYNKIKSCMMTGNPPIINILHENISPEKANEIETSLIAKHGRRFVDGGLLFNISPGGNLQPEGYSVEWSDERKASHRSSCKDNRLYDPTYEKLYEDYIVLGKTRNDIASENDVSVPLVKIRLKELGITKPKNVRYPQKNSTKCEQCGVGVITPRSIVRKYCSVECYRKQRNE
jgi:hypothetical protein